MGEVWRWGLLVGFGYMWVCGWGLDMRVMLMSYSNGFIDRFHYSWSPELFLMVPKLFLMVPK
jgi:hypothetical protein